MLNVKDNLGSSEDQMSRQYEAVVVYINLLVCMVQFWSFIDN